MAGSRAQVRPYGCENFVGAALMFSRTFDSFEDEREARGDNN